MDKQRCFNKICSLSFSNVLESPFQFKSTLYQSCQASGDKVDAINKTVFKTGEQSVVILESFLLYILPQSNQHVKCQSLIAVKSNVVY